MLLNASFVCVAGRDFERDEAVLPVDFLVAGILISGTYATCDELLCLRFIAILDPNIALSMMCFVRTMIIMVVVSSLSMRLVKAFFGCQGQTRYHEVTLLASLYYTSIRQYAYSSYHSIEHSLILTPLFRMVAIEDAERVESLIPRFKLEKLLQHGMNYPDIVRHRFLT